MRCLTYGSVLRATTVRKGVNGTATLVFAGAFIYVADSCLIAERAHLGIICRNSCSWIKIRLIGFLCAEWCSRVSLSSVIEKLAWCEAMFLISALRNPELALVELRVNMGILLGSISRLLKIVHKKIHVVFYVWKCHIVEFVCFSKKEIKHSRSFSWATFVRFPYQVLAASWNMCRLVNSVTYGTLSASGCELPQGHRTYERHTIRRNEHRDVFCALP